MIFFKKNYVIVFSNFTYYSGFLLANSKFKENGSVINASQSGPESYSACDASYVTHELVMEREREGFGDPERI